MKRLFSFVGAMGTVLLASAQLTSISVETVHDHDGSIDGVPAGYTTYRIYANLTNEYDYVSAVYGDSQDPMFLNSTDIFQVGAGGDFAINVNINPIFLHFPGDWSTILGSPLMLRMLLKVMVLAANHVQLQAGVGFQNFQQARASWSMTPSEARGSTPSHVWGKIWILVLKVFVGFAGPI